MNPNFCLGSKPDALNRERPSAHAVARYRPGAVAVARRAPSQGCHGAVQRARESSKTCWSRPASLSMLSLAK